MRRPSGSGGKYVVKAPGVHATQAFTRGHQEIPDDLRMEKISLPGNPFRVV
jgi:hypothetical protein